MNKIIVLYAGALVGFGLGIAALLQQGRQWQPSPLPVPSPKAVAPVGIGATPSPDSWRAQVRANFKEPLSQLLVQLILIGVTARIAGACFAQWGQPAVIGEMVAGILLGPSLFGWLFPGMFQFIFPSSSLGTLQMLSQIGVCLFLFVVGTELNLSHLRARAQTAVVVSHASILFPYFLGVMMAVFLFSDWASPGTDFVSFALFIGISMSITAFPVLARILEERGLSRTILGTTAITCAAVDDVTAWNILALVVALAKGGGLALVLLRIGLVVGFVAGMLFWVRPWLARRWVDRRRECGSPGQETMMEVMVLVLAAACATEVIGIHALFGAFLAGVVMPSAGAFRQFIKMRLDYFSSNFLLPLFFVFTGLRTHLGLLNDWESWWICLGIILTATFGKMGGTMIAARFTGMNWIDSFALGALMNTRGLMELIALNIGYDMGILSPRMFTMLVIMALATTFLTGPLLNQAARWKNRRELLPDVIKTHNTAA